MSGSGNSSSCLGMWFGAVVLILTFYVPIYFIFFDDVEDLVEDYSFQDVLFVSSIDPLDRKKEIERKSDFFEGFTKSYEMKSGIDLSTPIYEMAKNNDNIKSVEIKYKPYTQNKALDSILMAMMAEDDVPVIYEMVVELKSGKILKLNFYGIEPSFFPVKSAECLSERDFNFLFQVYNIPYDDREKFPLPLPIRGR